MSEAPKYDGGKPRVDLVAPDFILAIADVLRFGAAKYKAWSWANGKEWSRDYGAILRHLMAWYAGEDTDPESGLSHLAHAATDLMFLLVSQRRALGADDRPVFVGGQLRAVEAFVSEEVGKEFEENQLQLRIEADKHRDEYRRLALNAEEEKAEALEKLKLFGKLFEAVDVAVIEDEKLPAAVKKAWGDIAEMVNAMTAESNDATK